MTTAATLVTRSRRFLGDWPENDVLTASISSGSTTLTVADGAQYAQGWLLQIDSEALYVTANGTGTSVPVLRARRGTTAASHATASSVVIRPHFLDLEYLDAINSGIDASWPLLYQPINDTSITTSPTTYEYTVPTGPDGNVIRAIYRIEFQENSDVAYRGLRDWDVYRAGANSIIKFRRYLPAGTLRVLGFSPIAPLSSLADTLDSDFPVNCEDALTYYAAQFLLSSGESRRVREATGARDDRENANRIGSSMAASQSLLQRYMMRLQQSAMPPLPKNIKSPV